MAILAIRVLYAPTTSRLPGFSVSIIYEYTLAISAPAGIPAINRNEANMAKFVESADKIADTMNRIRFNINILFRPKRSARYPPSREPIDAPPTVAPVTIPRNAVPKCRSCSKNMLSIGIENIFNSSMKREVNIMFEIPLLPKYDIFSMLGN